MSLLVIDDSPADLTLIKIYLQKEGYTEMHFAKSAEEGIAMAKEHRPSVILTDTNIPRKNGYDICKEIKEIEDYSPWVIMMTGAIDGRKQELMDDAGIDDFCTKTFEVEDIVTALQRAVDQGHLTK